MEHKPVPPNINAPLIKVTDGNTFPANLDKLKGKYGNEAVESAVTYLTYKKAPPPLAKYQGNDYPILFVFRHGQSNDNINMIFSGWRAPGLTEKGREDALDIAELLKNKKIDILFSSDQPRTYDTMKLAMSLNEKAKNLEIITDTRLRERNYGDWQGHSKLEKHLENADLLKKVRRGWSTPPPNGESLEMVNERVEELLEEIVELIREKGVNVAIACSGNSIRPIRKHFEGLTEEQAAKIETPTGKDYAAYAVR